MGMGSGEIFSRRQDITKEIILLLYGDVYGERTAPLVFSYSAVQWSQRMKIAFIHHHLRPGGVSRVIREQIRSLEPENETLVICGEEPVEPPHFHYRVIPALAYDRDRNDRTSPDEAAQAVMDTVRSFWKNGADIFHVHNPTLGKNADFISMLKSLQSMKAALLLQIHDFAEDGRPQNYRGEDYPENCHYAVLNSRDYKILRQCGLCEEGLHLLPNAVRSLWVQKSLQNISNKDTVLYPVRAIRRKNIGEAVLISLFLPPGKRIGITLEPTGAIDNESYAGWQSFADTYGLAVSFRLGIGANFDELLARTSSMVTTSIKEGFGFSFLEPWTAKKMLYGRLLPDICSDFIQNNIDLTHLYTMLAVHTYLFDADDFRKKWKFCYAGKMKQFGLPVGRESIERSFNALFSNDTLDFGYLNEKLQKQVISSVYEKPDNRKNVLDINPFLSNIDALSGQKKRIEANRLAVERQYSLEKNQERLMRIYNQVQNITVDHKIDRLRLLAAFNTPERNQLLLCDDSF